MKTPHWKVKKLPNGRWLAHHPGCPPREHLCLRWLVGGGSCRIRNNLRTAYQTAAERYRDDAAKDWLTYGEGGGLLRQPPPAPAAQPNPDFDNDDGHLHIWTRLFGGGDSYVGCSICLKPRY